MIVTNLILEIQKYANKELSFGCIVEFEKQTYFITGIEYPLLLEDREDNDKKFYRVTNREWLLAEEQFTVVGHLVNKAWLHYLYRKSKQTDKIQEAYRKMIVHFLQDAELWIQTVLEWKSEIQEDALAFLQLLDEWNSQN